MQKRKPHAPMRDQMKFSVSAKKEEDGEVVYYLLMKQAIDLEEERQRFHKEMEELFCPHMILS